MDGSGNNIDQSIIRISTPLSDAGESTSEMCNSLPNIMSKAQQQHEAIFGRPGSTDNHRAKIVAYEEDLEYSQSSTGRNINNRTPQTSNTPAKINSNIPTQQHQSSNNNAMSGLINGRSPRLMPTHHHHHHHNMPPTHIGGQQQEPASAAAPTALMIMQRRRRSNSGDALRNSSSKMKNNHELNLSTSNKGKSPKVTSSNGSPPKDGTNVLSSTSEEQQDLDATAKNKNEEHPKQLNSYESAIQQQNELYNSVLSANATQQQPQQTAMRYNASLHSTLGGYPMGLPTQLTHPSVTMELIARDRARWEADYYTSGGGGLGMNDYGGGNSVSSYGANPSFRGMSSSAANSNIMQQQQPHMTPQGSGDQQQSQTTTQMGMGDTNMKIGQQPQQQQFYQPASHLHQSPTRQQGVLPAPASPHRNNRVFQERDYKNDRVWQEDDHHTRTTVDPTASSPKPERRHTEQTSNREMDKKTHLAAEGVVESAQLPPVPHLRDGGANNGVASTQQPQQVNITQGRPQVLPLSHQVPPVPQRDEGRFSVEEHAYHHSTAVAGMVPPAYNMHQAGVPPPTAVRPTRERELSDISMMAGSVGGGPMLLPVVYPNGTYGLIQYPPTPGSLVGCPTAAMHPGAYHVDPRQQGNMPWLNPNLVYQNIPRHSSDYDVSYAASNPAEETSHSNMKISSSRKNDKQNNDGNPRVLRHSAPEEAPAAKSNSNLPRKVSFSHLEIRTYETILCENPSCSGGPSLGLGWRYDPNHDCITVDEYEAHQAQIHGLPTGEYYVCRPEDLVLHRFEREAILLNTGYSRQDLADSVRSMNKVKNKRRQTVHNLPVAYFEEKVEVVNRILRRWMRKRERSSHMYEDWKKKTAQGKV